MRKKNYYQIDKSGNLLKYRYGQLVKKVSNSQEGDSDNSDDLIPFSGKKRPHRRAQLAQSYDTQRTHNSVLSDYQPNLKMRYQQQRTSNRQSLEEKELSHSSCSHKEKVDFRQLRLDAIKMRRKAEAHRSESVKGLRKETDLLVLHLNKAIH